MMSFSLSVWYRRMAIAIAVPILLSSAALADTHVTRQQPEQVNQEAGGDEAAQPKFIWGILLKYAASKAFEIFFEWAGEKMFQGMALPSLMPREAAVTAPGDAMLAPVGKSAMPIIPNVTDSAPSAPLAVENGRENYQGALLSLLVLQPDGRSLAVRPASAGFKSREKFRIRIGATFEGDLSLDNIDPQGKRNRLYPPSAEQVVRIRSGAPVILPLEPDSFFQFDDVAGEEKLVVTLRDPRAQGEAAAQTGVHRKDSEQGTGLLQEVSAGKFAAIAESIALQHR